MTPQERYAAFKADIIARWNRGDSAGLIARELRTSRNTVMGHINRARERGDDVRSGQPGKSAGRKIKRAAAGDGFRPSEVALIRMIDAAEGEPLPYGEAAEALGVAVATVKKLIVVIRRGRPEMRKSIATVYGVGPRWVGAAFPEITGGSISPGDLTAGKAVISADDGRYGVHTIVAQSASLGAGRIGGVGAPRVVHGANHGMSAPAGGDTPAHIKAAL